MADKDLSYENPERGWGQRLKSHLDTNVVVANYAQNGRSTKSVQTLGIWDRVKNDLKKGEYLFIQFGHNDSKESDTTRYAAPFGAYQDNIRLFSFYRSHSELTEYFFEHFPRSKNAYHLDSNL